MRLANMSGTAPFHTPCDVPISAINSLNDKSGVISPLTVTGSVDYASILFSESFPKGKNINYTHSASRNLYDRFLRGEAYRAQIGQAAEPGSSQPYNQQLAQPSSWTQFFSGQNFAYVIPIISASDQESQTLNSFRSGIEKIENSFIAASASAYYSKQNKFAYAIYKLSASINLPVIPASSTLPYPSVDEQGLRTPGVSNFIAVSGCYRANDVYNPAIFEINVPNRGRIRDIKVWVEFVHDHRGGRGPTSGSNVVSAFRASGVTGSITNDDSHGLGSVVIALRSPNVKFDFAHPLWNCLDYRHKLWRNFNLESNGPFWDQNAGIGNESYYHSQLTPADDSLPDQFREIPQIYKSSYLLWDGFCANYGFFEVQGNQEDPVFQGSPPGKNSFCSFESDIDMRTIFSDASCNLNPRQMNEQLYLAPDENNPGGSAAVRNLNAMTGTNNTVRSTANNKIYFRVTSSYNWASRYVAENFGIGTTSTPFNYVITGTNMPWMLDSRIPPGNLTSRNYGTSSFDGSTTSSLPPAGWLTGTGSTNDVNEFGTSGMNLGPPDIKPVYSLLDDLIVRKTEQEGADLPSEFLNVIDQGVDLRKTGFRPGLRGTEVQGKWQLMIGLTADFIAGKGMQVRPRGGIWFRQFRLEFLLEQNEDLNLTPQTRRKFRKKGYIPISPGLRRLQIMSGAADWDRGINYVYAIQNSDYGTTYGITDSTGSNIQDFSVFTQITGNLALELTGSDPNTFYTYLHNEFGTPYIPLSSASIKDLTVLDVDQQEQQNTKDLVSSLINPKPTLKTSQTLQSVLGRNKYTKTTLQKRKEFIDSLEAEPVTTFSITLTGTLP